MSAILAVIENGSVEPVCCPTGYPHVIHTLCPVSSQTSNFGGDACQSDHILPYNRGVHRHFA
jgi:hypothetical protein